MGYAADVYQLPQMSLLATKDLKQSSADEPTLTLTLDGKGVVATYQAAGSLETTREWFSADQLTPLSARSLTDVRLSQAKSGGKITFGDNVMRYLRTHPNYISHVLDASTQDVLLWEVLQNQKGPNDKYNLTYATGNFARFKGTGLQAQEFAAEEIRGADVQLLCSSPDTSKIYFAKGSSLRILNLLDVGKKDRMVTTTNVKGAVNAPFASCIFAPE
jgi:hypothetical protein